MIFVQLIAKSVTRLPWSSISVTTTGAVGMLRRVCTAFHGNARAALTVRHGAARTFAHIAALTMVVLAAFVLDQHEALAGLVNSDPELDAAMSCGAAKKTSAPCEVAACFSRYLANTPPAEVSADAKQVMSSAAAACRQPPAQQQDTKADEERMLGSARQCMVSADPCIVKTCYAEYLQKYGANGVLRAIAQSDLSRAQKACQPPEKIVDNGFYNARAKEACGAKPQFGITIAIKNGVISWEHDFRGISYKWVGVIEPTGGIRATVGNSSEFVADGQYTDAGREIMMHYPQCGNGTIPMSILGRLPDR